MGFYRDVYTGDKGADAILDKLREAGFVVVPKLERGEMARKVAAWRAFIAAMGRNMPRDANGGYNGTFAFAVCEAIKAYLQQEDNDGTARQSNR